MVVGMDAEAGVEGVSDLVVKFEEELHPRIADGTFTETGAEGERTALSGIFAGQSGTRDAAEIPIATGGKNTEPSERWGAPPGETQPIWKPKLDGFSDDQAELLGDYASSGGDDIRAAMKKMEAKPGEYVDHGSIAQAKAFTKLIDEHPKNYVGTINRGMSVPQRQVGQWKVGSVITFKVPSSWSTEERIAISYARESAAGDDGKRNVIFRAQAKTGVSIQHSVPDRYMREVVNRSNTRYKIVAKFKVEKENPLNRVGEYLFDLEEL